MTAGIQRLYLTQAYKGSLQKSKEAQMDKIRTIDYIEIVVLGLFVLVMSGVIR